MVPTSSEWLVFSQWLRRSIEPSGSTRTSAMFWTSRTSSEPRRTSRSGLYAAERPCRQDRGVVMGRHLGVSPIDLRLVETSLDDSDFGVVRHQQLGHAA